MKLDQLIHFLETARQEHLSKAARILRLSPSAVSYSIECLEEELGVSLFEKRGKRIFLTPAGQRLLAKIPQVQRSLAELRNHVTDSAPLFQGHYRIGATHVIAETFLAPAVARTFEKSDAVTVDLFSLRSSQVLKQVLEGELELGVCFSPQNHPRLEIVTLHNGQLQVYVRKGHPVLKSKTPIRDLAGFPAALPKAFAGIEVCDTHEVFSLHGVKPMPRFAFDHYGVAMELVRDSDAWGFFPDWMEKVSGFGLAKMPTPKTWKAPYSLSAVYLKDRFIDDGLLRLVSGLRSSVTLH
jgi:DNA-binding transcriptional LysR family regulator